MKKRFHISWSPMYRHWRIFDREMLSVYFGLTPSAGMKLALDIAAARHDQAHTPST